MSKVLYKSFLSFSFILFALASLIRTLPSSFKHTTTSASIAVGVQKPVEKILEEISKPHKAPVYFDKDIYFFTYHYVEYVKDNNDYLRKSLNVEPHIFEEHIKLIKQKGYKDIFAKEVPNILQNKDDKTKYVALTFDDGYKDFYEYVFPIIKKYNIKVTLYVVPSFINKKDYLSYSELIEISESNLVEIGSHGMSHSDLTKENKEKYLQEISESKKYLENILKKRIYTFCYPYGRYTDDIVKTVEKNGYIAAVSTDNGYKQNGNNLFKLQRIRAGGLVYFIK